jgi:hypothetical protein
MVGRPHVRMHATLSQRGSTKDSLQVERDEECITLQYWFSEHAGKPCIYIHVYISHEFLAELANRLRLSADPKTAKKFWYTNEILIYISPMTIIVAARFKVRTVFAHPNAGIVGSHPTRGTDASVRLFCVCAVLCVGSGLATGWSPVQRVQSTVNVIKKLKKWPSSRADHSDRAV